MKYEDEQIANLILSLKKLKGIGNKTLALDDSKLTLRLLKYFLKEDSLKEFILKNKDYFTSSYYLKELRENRLAEVAYW